MVVRLTEKCRTSKSINGRDSGVREEKGEGGRGFPTGLASSLKYCTRKNGLGRAAAEVRSRLWYLAECSLATVLRRRVHPRLGRFSRACAELAWCFVPLSTHSFK